MYRIEWNDQGQLTRIHSLETGRDVLPDGALGNVFQRLIILLLMEIHGSALVPGLRIVRVQADHLVQDFDRTIEIIVLPPGHGLLHEFVDLMVSGFEPSQPDPVFMFPGLLLIRRIA